VVFAKESEQGPQCALLENVVAAGWAISSNVSQSPDCLFADIKDRRRQKIDKLWNCLSIDNDLGVLSSP